MAAARLRKQGQDVDSVPPFRDQVSAVASWVPPAEGAGSRNLGHQQATDTSGSIPGNVHSFVSSVTPAVNLQTADVSELSLDPESDGEVPFFRLGDFWAALEQWSCYGVGVPLQLETGERVIQYYTPYLSGIQLFTRQDLDEEDRPEPSLEPCRVDSDWSDTDFPDSSSESSDTSERMQTHLFECAAAAVSASLQSSTISKPTVAAMQQAGFKNPETDMSTSSSGSENSDSTVDRALAALREESESPGPAYPTCVDCKGGELCFQYFEKNRPHMRLPICDQVSELEKSFPSITTLRSMDLHPSSWISVAWYPLYMIPSSVSLKDMGASFLTFHGLSTSLPGPAESCPRCREEFWAAPRLFPERHMDTVEERLSEACQRIGITQPPSDYGGASGQENDMQRAFLTPFAMAGYKVKGGIWADIRKFEHLKESAEAWVKQMGVNHPDFVFFSGGGFM